MLETATANKHIQDEEMHEMHHHENFYNQVYIQHRPQDDC
jgi:hypothetical protein